jgi:hypothetical protein
MSSDITNSGQPASQAGGSARLFAAIFVAVFALSALFGSVLVARARTAPVPDASAAQAQPPIRPEGPEGIALAPDSTLLPETVPPSETLPSIDSTMSSVSTTLPDSPTLVPVVETLPAIETIPAETRPIETIPVPAAPLDPSIEDEHPDLVSYSPIPVTSCLPSATPIIPARFRVGFTSPTDAITAYEDSATGDMLMIQNASSPYQRRLVDGVEYLRTYQTPWSVVPAKEGITERFWVHTLMATLRRTKLVFSSQVTINGVAECEYVMSFDATTTNSTNSPTFSFDIDGNGRLTHFWPSPADNHTVGLIDEVTSFSLHRPM